MWLNNLYCNKCNKIIGTADVETKDTATAWTQLYVLCSDCSKDFELDKHIENN